MRGFPRRRAVGTPSQSAVAGIAHTVAGLKRLAKKEPAVAASAAVELLVRIATDLDGVDSSSGAPGTAVNKAIAVIVPIIAGASVDSETRDAWLERLYEAIQADRVPYLEGLGEHWGDLCASESVASAWADRLIDATRRGLAPEPLKPRFYKGASACLSALHRAGRFDEIMDLITGDLIWMYQAWRVKALVAQGKQPEALTYAEACLPRCYIQPDIVAISVVCEELLLSSGSPDEAYDRFGLRANQRATCLGTFRALSQRYPHKPAIDILTDLLATTPGDEVYWFEVAAYSRLFDEALQLARRGPCEPKRLNRVSLDYREESAAFARDAALVALSWLIKGHGRDRTDATVRDAHDFALEAAVRLGKGRSTRDEIREMVNGEPPGDRLVTRVLGKQLGL